MNRIGKCVGIGGCSKVFEWDNEQVIKLFLSNTTRDGVAVEYHNSIAAWEAGLPAARPYELIELDGRPGIIFEKIIGETIKDRFFAQAYSDNQIKFDDEENDFRVIARVLHDIHKKSIPGILTIQNDDLKRSINRPPYLTDDEKREIILYLDNLPSKNLLCHGDPNPGNIIMRSGKPVMIDWMNASIGNPIADIAEFLLIFKYYVLPPESPSVLIDFFNASREIINAIFLDEYMKLSDMKYEEIDAWILPIAARKLSGDTVSEEERSMLVDVIRRRLNELA